MKLTYLGTAAAEGFPAVFCNCEYYSSTVFSHGRRNLCGSSDIFIIACKRNIAF